MVHELKSWLSDSAVARHEPEHFPGAQCILGILSNSPVGKFEVLSRTLKRC